MLTSILAFIASPLFNYLLTLFGAPAAGSLVMKVFCSRPFLGIAGHMMNTGKGLGIGLALWAKTGPLKAIFGPLVFLFVFAACFLWSVVDGMLSNLDGDNLKLALSLEKALGQGGSAARLGYVQSKINPAPPTPADVMRDAVKSPANVLQDGEAAVFKQAVDAGEAGIAAVLKQ